MKTAIIALSGFVSTHDGKTVKLEHALPTGSAIGLLAIDFASRTRLRVNGVTESSDRIRVREAYPNCPKYIQRRVLREIAPIDHGALASHRGGTPGFIRVEGDTLVVPDYPGNGMFNSLGNFLVDNAAGMTTSTSIAGASSQ